MSEQLTEHFNINEFRCNDGTPVPDSLRTNVQKLACNLEIIRQDLGVSMHVLSGYRTPSWNAKVGGATNSYHKKAMAADLTVKSMTPKQLHARILKLISAGKIKDGGVGIYRGFVHYDIGPSRRWNG